jgi:hypothetical protein
MADDSDRVRVFDEVYPGVLEAILAFSASRHRPVSDDEARRLVWRLARAYDRLRNEKIRQASRRRKGPRSSREKAEARRLRVAAAKLKPWSSKPHHNKMHWYPRLVRQAALLHGIGHSNVSAEVATTTASKVTRAGLTSIEKRAVDLLLGAKSRPGARDRDAQRLAGIVMRDWSAKPSVGRPPGAVPLANWDPERQEHRVPLLLGEFIDVALPIFAEFAGVDWLRMRVSAALVAVLAIFARRFGFAIRDEEVIDRFRRLVHSRNRRARRAAKAMVEPVRGPFKR